MALNPPSASLVGPWPNPPMQHRTKQRPFSAAPTTCQSAPEHTARGSVAGASLVASRSAFSSSQLSIGWE